MRGCFVGELVACAAWYNFPVGPQEPPLAVVKRRKLAWSGHVTHCDSLSTPILRGILEDGRCRGQRRKRWMDNVKEWTSLSMPELLTRASCGKRLEEDLC